MNSKLHTIIAICLYSFSMIASENNFKTSASKKRKRLNNDNPCSKVMTCSTQSSQDMVFQNKDLAHHILEFITSPDIERENITDAVPSLNFVQLRHSLAMLRLYESHSKKRPLPYLKYLQNYTDQNGNTLLCQTFKPMKFDDNERLQKSYDIKRMATIKTLLQHHVISTDKDLGINTLIKATKQGDILAIKMLRRAGASFHPEIMRYALMSSKKLCPELLQTLAYLGASLNVQYNGLDEFYPNLIAIARRYLPHNIQTQYIKILYDLGVREK